MLRGLPLDSLSMFKILYKILIIFSKVLQEIAKFFWKIKFLFNKFFIEIERFHNFVIKILIRFTIHFLLQNVLTQESKSNSFVVPNFLKESVWRFLWIESTLNCFDTFSSVWKNLWLMMYSNRSLIIVLLSFSFWAGTNYASKPSWDLMLFSTNSPFYHNNLYFAFFSELPCLTNSIK